MICGAAPVLSNSQIGLRQWIWRAFAQSALIPLLLVESVLIAVYLFDETEILTYKQMVNDQKMVAGLIYLDNYDEALESVEEVRRSLLTALIDRKITKYITKLPKRVDKLELANLEQRIKSIDAMRQRAPLPHGPMPNIKGARRMMRGK